jgi:hypothetical protein
MLPFAVYMAKQRTRSSAFVWLIGHPEETITGCRLPSKGQVLRHFFYHHTILHKTKSDSASAVVDSVLGFWGSANVPASTVCYCKKKVLGLVEQYEKLKKNRLKVLESCRMNEDIFRGDLEELFDISKRDVERQITNVEDRAFIASQQQDRTQSTMAGVDLLLVKSTETKRKRLEAEKKRKEKSDRDKKAIDQRLDSSQIDFLSSSSETEDGNDEELTSNLRPTASKRKRAKKVCTSFPVSSGYFDTGSCEYIRQASNVCNRGCGKSYRPELERSDAVKKLHS